MELDGGVEEDSRDIGLLQAEAKPIRGQEDVVGWPKGSFNIFLRKILL